MILMIVLVSNVITEKYSDEKKTNIQEHKILETFYT